MIQANADDAKKSFCFFATQHRRSRRSPLLCCCLRLPYKNRVFVLFISIIWETPKVKKCHFFGSGPLYGLLKGPPGVLCYHHIIKSFMKLVQSEQVFMHFCRLFWSVWILPPRFNDLAALLNKALFLRLSFYSIISSKKTLCKNSFVSPTAPFLTFHLFFLPRRKL